MIEKHMNAVKVKERQLLALDPDEWIMEEKFKGIRVWRIKTSQGVQLITRGGEDVTDNFPLLVNFDWTPDNEISQLDCELYDPAQEDEVVSGWANTISIDPAKTSNCVLKVFDVLNLDNICLANLPQIERKQILSAMRLKGPLETVPYFPAKDHRNYYDYIISTPNKYGKLGEGIMLKNKLASYAEGARQVGRWLKRKKRDQFDCIVMGFTDAKFGKTGKFAGLVGAVQVGMIVNGTLRHICNVSGMSDEVRISMSLKPEQYIGKVCSIWAMEQDRNSLALIEPSWHFLRIDKRPEECTYELERVEELEERMVDL